MEKHANRNFRRLQTLPNFLGLKHRKMREKFPAAIFLCLVIVRATQAFPDSEVPDEKTPEEPVSQDPGNGIADGGERVLEINKTGSRDAKQFWPMLHR